MASYHSPSIFFLLFWTLLSHFCLNQLCFPELIPGLRATGHLSLLCSVKIVGLVLGLEIVLHFSYLYYLVLSMCMHIYFFFHLFQVKKDLVMAFLSFPLKFSHLEFSGSLTTTEVFPHKPEYQDLWGLTICFSGLIYYITPFPPSSTAPATHTHRLLHPVTSLKSSCALPSLCPWAQRMSPPWYPSLIPQSRVRFPSSL